MDSATLKQRIKRDLPCFPDEVIEQWLYLEAQQHGWPLANATEVLSPYCLAQWQHVEWEKTKVPFHILIERMDEQAYIATTDIKRAHVDNEKNAYTVLQNSRRQFYQLLKEFERYSHIKQPLIALKINNEKIKILKGHHLLAMYRYAFEAIYMMGGVSCGRNIRWSKELLSDEIDVWLAEKIALE